jgi:carbamoyltransferase
VYVLGINSVYHEAAAAILGDGYPLAAVEEERFTGIRHGKDPSPYGAWLLPFHGIDYCLNVPQLTIDDLEHIAYSFQPTRRLTKNLRRVTNAVLRGNINPLQRELAYWFFNHRVPAFLTQASPRTGSIRRRFLLSGKPRWKFHFIEHHLAHAASAFFPAPFDEAAILSIDGIGETSCTLMAHGAGTGITKIKEVFYPNSLGFFYEEITTFLGFQRNHDEYKVMALAAYGKPRYYENLKKLLIGTRDGEYKVRIDFRRSSIFGAQELRKELGPPRLWGAPLNERHADIAASAQKILEDTVLHMVSWLRKWGRAENLCLAGGVALNCVLTERIRQESGFNQVWVQPAANDAGTALGAALWVWHSVLNGPRQYIMTNPYLGPEFSEAEIEGQLLKSKLAYESVPDIARKCAGLIAEGKTVGWFQGQMEWGPRALGNRSILADPRDPVMRDKLNCIKGREDFRPLAPAILEQFVGDYFECAEPSPFMLFARTVKPHQRERIPAVVHIDGSARLQTVNKKDNRLLHELIFEFKKITGIPLIVNTSLNYKGKPIVCTVEQAIDCFYNSGLDYLALGRFLLSKELNEKRGRFEVDVRREDLDLQEHSSCY